MDYITSQDLILPIIKERFGEELWLNLWEDRFWPYDELEEGDILFWYEIPSESIVWKSRIVSLLRFRYDRKDRAAERLADEFPRFDPESTYFQDGPEEGYCLAYKIEPLERLNLRKPSDFAFPLQGWLRVDDYVNSKWLGKG